MAVILNKISSSITFGALHFDPNVVSVIFISFQGILTKEENLKS